jgi:hypothetical protein
MGMRTFCDKCDRDITMHDRFHISFTGGRRGEVLAKKFANRDFCVACVRDIDIDKILEEAD